MKIEASWYDDGVKKIRARIASYLPQQVRKNIRAFVNSFLPGETIEKSKVKWNKLAEENARYFVMTDYGESISEEKFRESGKKDYTELIERDALLKQLLQPFSEKEVLEIGCGIGRITEFLGKHFKQVAGIDISEEMIRKGKERLGQADTVTLTATDGRSYPFGNGRFDFVFSFIVFQHMPDKATIAKNIAEIDRVLKIGGVAKIQLRGLPTSKKNWFYGPSFSLDEARELLKGTALHIVGTEGEEQRYFWLWLTKKDLAR